MKNNPGSGLYEPTQAEYTGPSEPLMNGGQPS